MKYTNHFKKLIKENTELTGKQFDLIFRIMDLESQISGMKKIKSSKKDYSSHQADTLIFNTQLKLDELTGNKNPEEIFEENYVKIVDSGLSVRATNALLNYFAEKHRINYEEFPQISISKLKDLTITEIGTIKNVGEDTLNDILEMCEGAGIKLKP